SAGTLDPPREQVHVEVAAAQVRDDGLRARRAAALKRLDAREQLGKGEGLGEIIVRPALQPLHPLVGRAERRKDNDRRVDAGRANSAQHRETVHSGKHPVEHDRRVMAIGRMEEPIASVAGDVDDIAVLLEALGDIIRRGRIIFDDEDFLRHGPSLGTPCHPCAVVPGAGTFSITRLPWRLTTIRVGSVDTAPIAASRSEGSLPSTSSTTSPTRRPAADARPPAAMLVTTISSTRLPPPSIRAARASSGSRVAPRVLSSFSSVRA